MDDRKLAAMMAAVQCRSLSRAAEQLGYTQSGMTQMMNSLERELDCRLLERDCYGVRLTQEGERLLPAIAEFVAAGRKLRSELVRLKATETERICVGTYASVARNILPEAIRSFRERCPELGIDIKVGRGEIVQWLELGKIDIAIVDEPREFSGSWIPLTDDPLAAAVPRECPLRVKRVTPEQLADYAFIMPQSEELRSRIVPLLEGVASRVIQVDSDDDETILSLVEQGVGVTILPYLSLKGHSQRVRVIRLAQPPTRRLGLLLPQVPRESAALLALYLKQAVR